MTKEKATEKGETKETKKATAKAPVKKAAPKKAPVKKATAPKKETAKKAAPKKETVKKETKSAAKKDAPKKAVKKDEAPKGIIETFKNDSLTVEKETLPYCRIKYTVVPTEVLWAKARKVAIKKIAKEVSIPGFRKGKAPEHIILKKHSAQVKNSTESSLADICFEESQKLGKTPILQGNNNVSFHVEENDGVKTLFFAFESEPTIPELELSNFSLEKVNEEKIDAKKVDAEIENIRGFYANWEQIEDRPVEIGDFVLLNVDDLDQDPPSRVFNDARFEVKEDKMVHWMRELVLGQKKGAVVEGISQPDESATEADKKAFKKKKVRITISSIEKSNLPAVDDELAKKVGAKSVEEMKERLEKLLVSKNERLTSEQQRTSIEKQMIEKVLFDVPATLLEKEANHRMSQLLNAPSFKKQWEEMSDEQKTEKQEEVKEKATQAIRLFYLCRKIVHTNKIRVSESDMKSNFDSVLDMMYADQQKLQYQSMNDDQKQMALTQTMMHKAEDHIISQLKQK